jgi:hypothetical protein
LEKGHGCHPENKNMAAIQKFSSVFGLRAVTTEPLKLGM